MAVLLGPAGFGLMARLHVHRRLGDAAWPRWASTTAVCARSPKQSAPAMSGRIARTVAVLRRVAIVLGLIGALLLVLFARPISSLTFGSDGHAGAVALLSAAVFLRLVTTARARCMQGMRRIGDMAKIGVLGALIGTMVSIADRVRAAGRTASSRHWWRSRPPRPWYRGSASAEFPSRQSCRC